MSDRVLDLQGVSKIYRTEAEEIRALDNVSFAVNRGEFVGVTGPSGSGKSTLLHLVGCLDTPSSGQILFDGNPVHTLGDQGLATIRNERIGFVFQNFNLLPRISALNNVSLPLNYAGYSRKERSRKALASLERVRLGHRTSHKPSQMSGGERQRVAIARALVMEPSLILADEPTGNLDQKVGTEIMSLLFELNREQGATIVLITHDMAIAQKCPRVVSIRDGKIVEDSLS